MSARCAARPTTSPPAWARPSPACWRSRRSSILIAEQPGGKPGHPSGRCVEEIDLDDVDFVSNDELEEVLEDTPATPEQVDEVVRINTRPGCGAQDLVPGAGGPRAAGDRPGRRAAAVSPR